jgi:hypothetical protein
MSMNLVDLANGVESGISHYPKAALTANTNGAGVDLKDSNVRTHLVVQVGALADNATVRFNVEESDDNTTFTTPADTTNTNTGTLNTANTQTILSFQRGKRYARANFTLVAGGANANAFVTATLLAQKKSIGSNTAGYSIAPQT